MLPGGFQPPGRLDKLRKEVEDAERASAPKRALLAGRLIKPPRKCFWGLKLVKHSDSGVGIVTSTWLTYSAGGLQRFYTVEAAQNQADTIHASLGGGTGKRMWMPVRIGFFAAWYDTLASALRRLAWWRK
jgi:hypothetical protein